MIEDEDEANLAQMTEAVLQDGYAIVQEFVDGGENGDARIFLLDGQILEREGQLAAFRRVPTGNDPRANISAGGRSVPLEIGDVERGIVEAMSKKLVADGMWFVGIDVIGDKVVEINSDSPGGMQSVEWLYEIAAAQRVGPRDRDRAAEEVDGNRLVAHVCQPMAEVDLRVAAALHAVEHEHGRGIRVVAGHQNSVEVEAGVLIVEGKRRQVGHVATVPTADPSGIRRSLSAYRPAVSTSPCRGRRRSGCPRSWPTRRSPARPRRPKPLRAS